MWVKKIVIIGGVFLTYVSVGLTLRRICLFHSIQLLSDLVPLPSAETIRKYSINVLPF